MVREGDPAPEFTLRSDSGEEVALSSLSGRPVVLYFYPKDDTQPTNWSRRTSDVTIGGRPDDLHAVLSSDLCELVVANVLLA
jgi:peroxiredoxin